jgi:ABC-type enterochelin transport system permease subunit
MVLNKVHWVVAIVRCFLGHVGGVEFLGLKFLEVASLAHVVFKVVEHSHLIPSQVLLQIRLE